MRLIDFEKQFGGHAIASHLVNTRARAREPEMQEFGAFGNQLFADRVQPLLGVLEQVNALQMILGLCVGAQVNGVW